MRRNTAAIGLMLPTLLTGSADAGSIERAPHNLNRGKKPIGADREFSKAWDVPVYAISLYGVWKVEPGNTPEAVAERTWLAPFDKLCDPCDSEWISEQETER